MNEEKSAAPPNANGARLAKLNSPWFVWPAAVVLAVLLYFGLHYLNFALTNETTDDAFIAAHVVSVAPRIAGQVSAVHVLDNEMVRSNELLVEIDPSNYAITVAQKQAAAASQDANVKTVLAVDELMHKKVITAQANARKAKADADAVGGHAPDALRLISSACKELRKENTISQQEFDAAQAADTKAEADLKAAQAKCRCGKFQGGRGRNATGRGAKPRSVWPCPNGRRRRPMWHRRNWTFPTRKFSRRATAASRARPSNRAIMSRSDNN